jgi:osmoprotectant transport system permease protein
VGAQDCPEVDRDVSTLAETFRWFADAVNYSGTGSIPVRVIEHVQLSSQSVLLAALLALPVGLYVGHKKRFEFAAITVGNIGRAVPSFGLIAVLFVPTSSWPGDLGYWAVFIAMVLLAIPPILINTSVGIRNVDRDTVEAARGMGMTGRDVLFRIEIPLAVPLIVTGLRTASVQVIATATLGAITSIGGLGRFIIDGFATGRKEQVLGGAILVALLAILTEVTFSLLEGALAPRTSSGHRRWFRRSDSDIDGSDGHVDATELAAA